MPKRIQDKLTLAATLAELRERGVEAELLRQVRARIDFLESNALAVQKAHDNLVCRPRMSDREIYEQTQELALHLAKSLGYESVNDRGVCCGNSKNPRAQFAFEMATVAQIVLCRHEMADVIDAVEEVDTRPRYVALKTVDEMMTKGQVFVEIKERLLRPVDVPEGDTGIDLDHLKSAGFDPEKFFREAT